MTAIIAMLWENLSDAGTLTASSSTANTPISLLQNKHVHQKWRSTSGVVSVVCDLGASSSIDTISLVGLSGDEATLRVRVSTVDSTGVAGDAHDSGTIMSWDSNYLPFVHLIDSPVSGRYVRVDIIQDADFVEAGRLVVGLRSQFEINFQPGWGRAWVDPTVKTIGRSGQAFDDLRDMYRTLDLAFEFLTEDERWDIIEPIDFSVGIHGDVLVITDPDSDNMSRDSLWGFMESIDPVVEPILLANDRRYRRIFRFRERL